MNWLRLGYVWYRVRRVAARRRWTYMPLLRVRRLRLHLAARPDSAVCIEGFPRSGNTYAVATFEQANPTAGHIARHLHAIGQIQQALRHRVPTVVLVRDPVDAVASLAVRGTQATLVDLFRDYTDLYGYVVGVKSRLGIVGFQELTADAGVVSDRLATHFGTDFARFEHSPERDVAVVARIEQLDVEDPEGGEERTVARRSTARSTDRARYVAAIHQEVPRATIDRARQLHRVLTS